MKTIILLLITSLSFNSFATRVDTTKLNSLTPAELQVLHDTIGVENTDALIGAVSDGGGDRASTAVFVGFYGSNKGVDANTINYLNEQIKSADILNLVKDSYQYMFGAYGQTIMCINFKHSEDHGPGALSYNLIKNMAHLIIQDQVVNHSPYARSYVWAGKSCTDISKATLQNLPAYLN